MIIDGIMKESTVICNLKGIELITHNKVSEADIILNRDLVERAVLNLIKNAVEHTNSRKMIKLYFECLENKLVISVEDFGKGFTSEALKYAKNQFYTEKSERSEEHYGLGMYFASNVAEKYNGSITYYNKPDQTGAMVVFEIRIVFC
ncbi:MAG TPA: hypothetical protein DHW61_16240 [Lachnoclostridium phytofermentans]|uniref:Histidine kinase domain-containing protein n=1 Tax=Lachnoclostridium phytofermentans TaxID=66219 RepID=A0A3D2X9V8_9FIRM|nr:ATP-binding protein [Lachnoclostridium sp.]HCL03930.1 hypothetical protein [Lachnoclostridium phytofermentans]